MSRAERAWRLVLLRVSGVVANVLRDDSRQRASSEAVLHAIDRDSDRITDQASVGRREAGRERDRRELQLRRVAVRLRQDLELPRRELRLRRKADKVGGRRRAA